jgi:hypothetical protein
MDFDKVGKITYRSNGICTMDLTSTQLLGDVEDLDLIRFQLYDNQRDLTQLRSFHDIVLDETITDDIIYVI